MEIQQRFQPLTPPTVLGYELQGISFPCYEIGGDYYDFIEREDGRLIALGDVSGKENCRRAPDVLASYRCPCASGFSRNACGNHLGSESLPGR